MSLIDENKGPKDQLSSAEIANRLALENNMHLKNIHEDLQKLLQYFYIITGEKL